MQYTTSATVLLCGRQPDNSGDRATHVIFQARKEGATPKSRGKNISMIQLNHLHTYNYIT